MKRRIILIFMIFVILLISVLSASAIFIKEEKDNSIDSNYIDYYNCKIGTDECGVDGKAFLFPGFSSSWLGPGESGVNVNRSFGILIAEEFVMGSISFNDDIYYGDWKSAFILSFNGFFINYYDKAYRVFEIDGTAKFVRVYF